MDESKVTSDKKELIPDKNETPEVEEEHNETIDDKNQGTDNTENSVIDKDINDGENLNEAENPITNENETPVSNPPENEDEHNETVDLTPDNEEGVDNAETDNLEKEIDRNENDPSENANEHEMPNLDESNENEDNKLDTDNVDIPVTPNNSRDSLSDNEETLQDPPVSVDEPDLAAEDIKVIDKDMDKQPEVNNTDSKREEPKDYIIAAENNPKSGDEKEPTPQLDEGKTRKEQLDPAAKQDIHVDSTIIPDTTALLPQETDEDQAQIHQNHTEIPVPDGTTGVEILPDSQPPTRVYKLRFYILLMFSLLGFTQNMGWNTWGPLTRSAEVIFDWKDADIALLANWGPIAFIVSIVFFSWLMDVKGIRWSCVVTAGLLVVGFGFRCITPHIPASQWLIHIGQAFIGLAGPITMGGPPLVSAVWFPVHERTTATAFAVFISVMGLAVSFIIGPEYVPSPMCNNCTSGILNKSDCAIIECSNTTDRNITNIQEMTTKTMELMYIEFGWSVFLFLIVLIYLPARPPLPPSVTATQQRTSFKKGIFDLLRHQKFWLLGIPYALSTGVYNCWGSVLAVNLNPLHKVISADEAGWIGFYGTIAGGVTSVAVARFADIFARRMKLFLLVLYAGAVVSFAWFAVVCQQIINLTPILISVSLYISMILGSMFINGGVPLFYELVCESCYPIAEGVTNGFLTWLNNVAGLVFLLIMMLRPYIGTVWMNWFLVGCILLCMPILFIFKEKYQRHEIDTTGEDDKPITAVN